MKRIGVVLLLLLTAALLVGCGEDAEGQTEAEYTDTFEAPATPAPLTADDVRAAYTGIVRQLRDEMGVYADGGTDGLVYGRLSDMNQDGFSELVLGYLRGGQARVRMYGFVDAENAVKQLLDTRAGYAEAPATPDTTLYFSARYLILSESNAGGEHLYFYQVRDGELVTLEYQTYYPTEDTADVGYTLDGLNIDETTYRSFVGLYWGAGKTDALSLPSAVMTYADGTSEQMALADFLASVGL